MSEKNTAPDSAAPTYRLRLPGPTAVPPRVSNAIAQPVVNHRGPEFRAIYARTQELLKPILGTRNHVFLLASSGTGAMEASIINILSPGDRVLVVVGGQFGERFAGIAKTFGARVDLLETEWGRAVDPSAIEKRVAVADYRAVVVEHNESSTGIVADSASIGAVLKNSPTLLVVDSVSGLGGLEMKQDEWGVDVVASASQKCLMCPPGIGLASISPKAWKFVERENGMPRFYWDFRKYLSSGEKSETPFTAPVNLIAGLTEALEMIHEEGLQVVLARHRRHSSALRVGCVALGLSAFGQTDALSPTVVAVNVPENLNGADIVRALYERHKTVIAGARNKLAGRIIRIGTMGFVRDEDILTDLRHLEEVLTHLGLQVAPGAGVAAASAILRA